MVPSPKRLIHDRTPNAFRPAERAEVCSIHDRTTERLSAR
jgi:hypothetical protein